METFVQLNRILRFMNDRIFMRTFLFFLISMSSILSFCARNLNSVKADAPPRIDGVLSDKIWSEIDGFSDFTQSYPDPGIKPSFKTEVKIAYNEKNIYIGVFCYDNEPSLIDRRIRRKDRNELSDSIILQLDPFETKREAYGFVITASSSLADFFVYNEFSSNWEWNGVWEGAASIHSDGWSAEFSIPFSTLRVFKSESLPMGIQVKRTVKRFKEEDILSYIAPSERKNVSGFATIDGLKGIRNHKKMEVIPFLVFKNSFHTRKSFYKRGNSLDAGLDFSYPLFSRFTLTGTVNSDFGQVEQDSTVLNLSAYETYFSENRPFFLEGFQIFNPAKTSQWSGTTFLYTRRIGSPPYEPESYQGKKIIYAPQNTTILGALKLSGTTQNRLNVATFLAITESERAKYADDEGNLNEEILKKQTLFGAFRINQNFGINSSIGIISTYKDEVGGRKALLNAITSDLHSDENRHNFSFSLSNTQIEGKNYKICGTAFEAMYIEKFSKNWTFSSSYIAHPKDYNPNDMGYLRRNDDYKFVTTIERNVSEPEGHFNQTTLGIYAWYGKNGDGLILTRGGEVDFSGEFLNHNSIGAGFSVEFPFYDDREARLENFAIYRETIPAIWIGFSTDKRKDFYLSENIFTSKQKSGFLFHTESSYTYRFSDKCRISQSLELTRNSGDFLFAGVSKNGRYPLFADVSYSEVDFTTRFSYTFTPELTFDLYSQLFSAAGSYSNFQKLLSPTKFEPSKATSNPNFHFGTNNLTAVLRWEFKPLSALYIVFSHGQSGYFDFDKGDSRAGMSYKREFNLWTSSPRDDLFLIKFSYRF